MLWQEKCSLWSIKKFVLYIVDLLTQEKDHTIRDCHKQIRRLEENIQELAKKNDGKEVQMKVRKRRSYIW